MTSLQNNRHRAARKILSVILANLHLNFLLLLLLLLLLAYYSSPLFM